MVEVVEDTEKRNPGAGKMPALQSDERADMGRRSPAPLQRKAYGAGPFEAPLADRGKQGKLKARRYKRENLRAKRKPGKGRRRKAAPTKAGKRESTGENAWATSKGNTGWI